MARKIIGIDISHEAVCAAVLNSGIKGDRLEDHAVVRLNGGSVPPVDMVSAISEIIKSVDTSGAVFITGFPADDVSFRNLTAPFTDPRKIRQILPFELEPMLPYGIDDVVTDFELATQRDETGEAAHVLAMAVPVVDLHDYMERFRENQIDPETITVSGFPTVRYLITQHGDSANWLMADIREKATSLFAVCDGAIRYARSFPSDPDHPDRLVMEIRRTMTAISDIQRNEIAFEYLYITGKPIDVGQHRSELEHRLGLTVRTIDVLRESDIAVESTARVDAEPGLLNDALAMALLEARRIRGPNLRRGPFARKTHWAEHRKRIIGTGILAAVVLLLAMTNLLVSTRSLEKRADALNARIVDVFQSAFPDVDRIVDPVQQMKAKIEEARASAVIPGVAGRSMRAIDVLDSISRSIPGTLDTEFTRLVLSIDSLLISGQTDTFNSVDALKSRLDGIDGFQSVTITSANMDKSGNRVNFKLKVQL